ncbi:MAG: hypothetical protein ACP5RE_03820 [Candidatus Acidifodinimicrobium sp.]
MTVEIDYGIQTRLDLYIPRQAGRIVRPDEIVDICGDIVSAQDHLRIWQSRHRDVSDQMDLGNGMIGVKVYYSARKDPEQEVIKNKWHEKAERRRGGR